MVISNWYHAAKVSHGKTKFFRYSFRSKLAFDTVFGLIDELVVGILKC